MADKNTIKNWFLTGLKPTQAQFSATWDSFWHKDEKIPITAINDVENILAEKADAEVVDYHLTNEAAHANLFNAKEDKNKRGASDGYAPLNNFTKLAIEYLNVVNDLVTGGVDSLLTAEQGKLLQLQITAINTLLTSDDVNLDTVQERIDMLKKIQLTLDSILVNDLTTGGTTKALTAEMGKVIDANVVHKTGDEDIEGIKTFSSDVKGKKFVTEGGTSDHYVTGTGTLALFNDTISRNIIRDLIPSIDVTGTVSEVLLNTYLIPANTFKAEDVLVLKEFTVSTDAVGANIVGFFRLKVGPTNVFSSATLLAQTNVSGLSGNKNTLKVCTSHVIRSGNIRSFVIGAPGSLTNAGTGTNIKFDPSVDNYLFTSLQNSSAGVVQQGSSLIITN